MKRLILFLTLILVCLASPSLAANKFWWASCRTGGGDCLDGIDGNDLTAGDGALVALDSGSTTPEVYFYRCYASSASESDPLIIAPDNNPGTLRWHLVNIYGASINAVAVDGSRRIDVLINGSRSPASGHAELYPEGTSTDSRWKMSNQVSSSTTEDTIVGIATSDTLTHKTIKTTAHTSGDANIFDQIKYVWLTNPQRCDETGALLDTTKTNTTFGQCKFSNSADKAGNYAIYKWAVPRISIRPSISRRDFTSG